MPEVRLRYTVDDRLVFKVSEAAKMLDVDVPTIYRHIRAGSLDAIDLRLPGAKAPTWRITRNSLEAFLAGAAAPLRAVGK